MTKAGAARGRRLDLAVVALGLLLVATSIPRFTLDADRPLWLDEVWTGMIVTQRSFGAFVHQCSLDANAPLYSVLAALWAQVTGISDGALRALPALIGCAAPLIALWPRQDLDRATRITWCALLACWAPGIWYSQEARPYTLAFALAAANAIAYASLISRPSQRAAWLWTTISSLLILTHYFGFILAGIQGLVYLSVHRLRALRTWPAALAFAPPFAMIAYKASDLIGFSGSQHSWIPYGSVPAALADLSFIVPSPVLLAASVWFIVAIVLGRRTPTTTTTTPSSDDQLGPWLSVACSMAAVIAAIALSFFRPLLVPRYLTEFVPGVLLGLSLAAVRFSRGLPFGSTPLVAIFAAFTVFWMGANSAGGNTFSWEKASDALISTHPRRLVFMWDTPLGGEPTSLAGVGGFFFARAGHPVSVDPVIDTTEADPSPLLLRHASAPGSVIIWIYDLNVRRTAAIRFPPKIEQLDPHWRCHNYGAQALGVIGCSRYDLPPRRGEYARRAGGGFDAARRRMWRTPSTASRSPSPYGGGSLPHRRPCDCSSVAAVWSPTNRRGSNG